jgi:hypothetical protein|tara:strand:- start:887 stop:1270 length:384 start_codon:yes stop_codon:yes gene_type:complete
MKNKEMKNYADTVKGQNKKVSEFSSVLEDMALDDKKKLLWMHIYEHALEDRTHAYMLFTEMYLSMEGKPSENQFSGPVLAKYIERMSKSNDQILRLAELVQKAQEISPEEMSEDDIFKTIQNSKDSK